MQQLELPKREISIEDAGPIIRASIPLPPGGGITVLRGVNGSGKSTALDAIDVLGGKKRNVPIRDGAIEARVSGLGRVLTISKSKQIRGEAEVRFLEASHDLWDFVEGGGLKDPAKADAVRVKALVAFTGACADAALFYPLVGGAEQFDMIADPETVESGDLLLMAARFKRDLEKVARQSEGESSNAKSRAEAARKSIETVDLTEESRADVLQHEFEQAVSAESKVKSDAESAARAIDQASKARKAIASAIAQYSGPSVAESTVAVAAVEHALSSANERLDDARRALAAAQKQVDAETANLRTAKLALSRAEDHDRITRQWSQQVDAGASVQEVPQSELLTAKTAVEMAREAVERGSAIRKAKGQLAELDQLIEKAAFHAGEANKLRQAAQAVDGVLTKVMQKAGLPFQVEAVNASLRLTVESPDRRGGRECFAELSFGERSRMAVEVAVKVVGPNGFFTVPQILYEGWDPQARAAILAQVQEHGINIVTAEATDGPLAAQVFNGEAAA